MAFEFFKKKASVETRHLESVEEKKPPVAEKPTMPEMAPEDVAPVENSEELAWKEHDAREKIEREMLDKIQIVVDLFRTRIESDVISKNTKEEKDTELFDDEIHLKGLGHELADDLRDIAKEYGVYANPRENPELFEPRGGGFPKTPEVKNKITESFIREVRGKLQSMFLDIQQDHRSWRYPALNAKRLSEFSGGYKEVENNQNSIYAFTGDFGANILEEIFADPRGWIKDQRRI